MPLRWSTLCKGSITLRQPIAGRQGHLLQRHTQGFAKTSRLQHSIEILTSPHLRRNGHSSCVVAVFKTQRQSRGFASTVPQGTSQTSAGSANNVDASSEFGGFKAVTEDVDPSFEYPSSKMETKRSKFAILEKSKENRFLVNQLLKDKGHLSYNWRVPTELLENRHLQSKAESPDSSGSVIRKIVPNLQSEHEHEGSELVHRVRVCNPRQPKLVSEIERPSIWSETNLALYIEDLVNFEYRKKAMLYPKDSLDKRNINLNNVISALDDIFGSPTTKRYLSSRAYKTALCFYYDIYMFSKARALYVQWETSGMNIPSDVFNTVLRGAASSQDLHNFTFILQKCLQRGFQPDIETWNILLTSINSGKVRAVIIQRMREIGVLDTFSKNGHDLRMIVQHELAYGIGQCADREALLDYMDKWFGNNWLTTSTGNKLLHEFGKLKSIPESLDLLPGMKLRGWKPDEISLNTLLWQALLLRQHKQTIEILERFRLQFGTRPGKQAHETLFLLARRSRLLNFTRVVWVSACVHGHTTFSMRKFLSQSMLCRDTMVQPLDGRSRFNKLAGKFVVGFNTPREMVAYGPGCSYKAREPFTHRSSQMLLKSDLLAADGRYLQEDLEKQLLKALELDLKSNLLKTTNVQQLFDNGLQIPLRVPDERLIRRCPSDGPQEIGGTPKVSNSVAKHNSTKSLSRPVRPPSFRKVHSVGFAKVRSLRIRKLVFSSRVRNRPQYIQNHIARLRKMQVTKFRRVRGPPRYRSMSSFKERNPQSPHRYMHKYIAQVRKVHSIIFRMLRGLKRNKRILSPKAENPRKPRLYMQKPVARDSQKFHIGKPLTSCARITLRPSTFVPRLQSPRFNARNHTASRTSSESPTHPTSGEPLVRSAAQKLINDLLGEQTLLAPNVTQPVPFGEASAKDLADKMASNPSAPIRVKRSSPGVSQKGLIARVPLSKHLVGNPRGFVRRIFLEKGEFGEASPRKSADGISPKLPAPSRKVLSSSKRSKKAQIARKPRAALQKHDHDSTPHALIRKPLTESPLIRTVKLDEAPSQGPADNMTPKLPAPPRARNIVSIPIIKVSAAPNSLRKHFTAKPLKPRPLIRMVVDSNEVLSQDLADNMTSKLPAPPSTRRILSEPSGNGSAARTPLRKHFTAQPLEPRPPTQKPLDPGPPTIVRKHLVGIAETDVIPNAKENSTSNATKEEPVGPIVRKDFTNLPRVPIRKHPVKRFTRYAVAPKSREPSIDSEMKPLPASVETAHIHSSLDKVLGLVDSVDKDTSIPVPMKPSPHQSRTPKQRSGTKKHDRDSNV